MKEIAAEITQRFGAVELGKKFGRAKVKNQKIEQSPELWREFVQDLIRNAESGEYLQRAIEMAARDLREIAIRWQNTLSETYVEDRQDLKRLLIRYDEELVGRLVQIRKAFVSDLEEGVSALEPKITWAMRGQIRLLRRKHFDLAYEHDSIWNEFFRRYREVDGALIKMLQILSGMADWEQFSQHSDAAVQLDERLDAKRGPLHAAAKTMERAEAGMASLLDPDIADKGVTVETIDALSKLVFLSSDFVTTGSSRDAAEERMIRAAQHMLSRNNPKLVKQVDRVKRYVAKFSEYLQQHGLDTLQATAAVRATTRSDDQAHIPAGRGTTTGAGRYGSKKLKAA